jgi:hypothetical protein
MTSGMVLNKLLHHLFHSLSIGRSALTRKFIEEFVEMGKIIETAFKTDVGNRHLAF